MMAASERRARHRRTVKQAQTQTEPRDMSEAAEEAQKAEQEAAREAARKRWKNPQKPSQKLAKKLAKAVQLRGREAVEASRHGKEMAKRVRVMQIGERKKADRGIRGRDGLKRKGGRSAKRSAALSA